MTTLVRQTCAVVFAAAALSAALAAHPMMVKGTVAAVEPTRIQIRTGEEKKGESPEWILIDAKTKVFRDKTLMTYDKAKIRAGERAVVNADHDAKGVMMAVDIHLAAASDR